MAVLKLYMLLLGCKPPGRHTEQHDIFFAVAGSLKELVPKIKEFWPEPDKIHIDAWREVTTVDDFKVSIACKGKTDDKSSNATNKLFFINLGGYQQNKFEEQHYVLLTVKKNKMLAFKEAKQTLFFKTNYFDGTSSHIDDKYGLDVDDLYEIEEILSPLEKKSYQIELTHSVGLKEDPIHLGYFKLDSL